MTDLAHIAAGGGHVVELPGAYGAEQSTTEAWADPSKFPTLVFEVSDATDPLDASPTWTDITAYLMSFNVNRGRAGEGGLGPGSATFVLDDPARALEGGDLVPSRRVRLRATAPAEKPIFDGFIDNPKRTYGRERGVMWELPCYDLLQFVAGADTATLAENAGAGEKTGARIGRLLDIVGVPAGLRDIDTGRSTCAGHSGTGSVLAEIEKVVATEYGAAWVTADGVFTFRERHNLPTDYMLSATSDTHAQGPLVVSSSLDRVSTALTVDWDGGTVTGVDAAAKAIHGLRTSTVSTLLTKQTEAQALLEWRLLRESTPADHVPTVGWSPVTDPATVWALLQIDLFDRVNLNRTLVPTTPSAFLTFDMRIETLSWAGVGMEISCTLGLAPFVSTGDIWTWDDEWDNSDGLVWSF